MKQTDPQTTDRYSDITPMPPRKIIDWLTAELKEEEGRGNLGRVCVYQSIIYHLGTMKTHTAPDKHRLLAKRLILLASAASQYAAELLDPESNLDIVALDALEYLQETVELMVRDAKT